MGPKFDTPEALPSQQPILAPEIQAIVTKAQISLERLNQLICSLPNPKILIRPVIRKEAHSTAALEGLETEYAQLIGSLVIDPSDLILIETRNFMIAAESAVDDVMVGKKIDIKFVENLHKQLFDSIPKWQKLSGHIRRENVKIVNAGGYEYFPMEHGPKLQAKLNELLNWFPKSKDWDPIVAIALFHYQFETIHPFEDGNGRIGRLISILQLSQKNLLTYPVLDTSTWLRGKKLMYHGGFQKVRENEDWNTFVGIFARAVKDSADTLIGEIGNLLKLQEIEKTKVRKTFRKHSRAVEVIDYLMAENELTVQALSEELGISYKSANALVSKMVKLELLTQIGESIYERRFTNTPLLEYAKGGF